MALRRNFDTVVAQVYWVIAERFADCEPFSVIDLREALPWVEDRQTYDGYERMTQRLSAALSHLRKREAIILFDTIRQAKTNQKVFRYFTDRAQLENFKPAPRCVRLGCTRSRKSKKAQYERRVNNG